MTLCKSNFKSKKSTNFSFILSIIIISSSSSIIIIYLFYYILFILNSTKKLYFPSSCHSAFIHLISLTLNQKIICLLYFILDPVSCHMAPDKNHIHYIGDESVLLGYIYCESDIVTYSVDCNVTNARQNTSRYRKKIFTIHVALAPF